ncbi:unnamed protein product [Urochloa humidicola]
MVERSDLTALEFLMSKQHRGRVCVSEGNAVGARAPNIFNEVAKFHKRFEEMKQKSASRESQESETVRQSRTSAVHTIRSMSNWWYWRPFGPSAPATIVLASRLLPLTPARSHRRPAQEGRCGARPPRRRRLLDTAAEPAVLCFPAEHPPAGKGRSARPRTPAKSRRRWRSDRRDREEEREIQSTIGGFVDILIE